MRWRLPVSQIEGIAIPCHFYPDGAHRSLPPATITSIRPRTLWADTPSRPRLPRETTLPDTVAEKPAKTPDSDGPLLVAATGVPDDDSGELRVTVHENVPNSVP